MTDLNWLDLQLFAGEGAGGEGSGDAADTGDTPADAEQARLLELGVPADKIRRRAKSTSAQVPEGAIRKTSAANAAQDTRGNEADADTQDAAAATDTPTETNGTGKKPTWDELMEDPDYNKEAQNLVAARLRGAKDAEAKLKALAPAIELLCQKHNLDPNNVDYDALNDAISNDNSFYEDKSIELGVPVEIAKRLDNLERESKRRAASDEEIIREQRMQAHFNQLENEAAALKKVFPGFDLKTELKNPVFARMTAPGGGISVEDAYYAVHRQEIQNAAMQVTAQKTAEQISNSIQAGMRRPDEAGQSSQGSSVAKFDYSKATAAERKALKQRIYDAAARGEKLYPGR